jgi:ABC-type lipoprotein export system ATPase subunit
MIELKNVERSYKTEPTETWVLRRIGLTVNESEFVTVMGPSGEGKSSLLNVLALLNDGWMTRDETLDAKAMEVIAK